MQAIITIQLGNAAMLTNEDIAATLDKLNEVLRNRWADSPPQAGDQIQLRDANGNVVGGYTITEAS